MKKIYAFLMMASALAACTREEQPRTVEEPSAQTYTLTVEARKGTDTKALTLTDKTLNATWETT